MDKELQNKLVEILANLQSNIGQAKDFTLAQLPDIAQSYLTYGRISITAFFILFSILLFAAIYITLKCGFYSSKLDRWGSWPDSRIAAAFFGTLGCLILVIISAAGCQDLFLVWLAPKVWLLKELAHLVR